MTRSLFKLFTLAVLFSGLYACVSNNDIEYQPQPLPELNFETQRQGMRYLFDWCEPNIIPRLR